MDRESVIGALKAEAENLKDSAATSTDPHLIARYVALASSLVQEAIADRLVSGLEHVGTDTLPIVWNQKFLVKFKFKKKDALLADYLEQDTFMVQFGTRDVVRASDTDIGAGAASVPLATLIASQSEQVMVPAEARADQDAEVQQYLSNMLPELQTERASHTCQRPHYYTSDVRTIVSTQLDKGTPIPGNPNNATYDYKQDNISDGTKEDSRIEWYSDR
jgi:hypothetical protein